MLQPSSSRRVVRHAPIYPAVFRVTRPALACLAAAGSLLAACSSSHETRESAEVEAGSVELALTVDGLDVRSVSITLIGPVTRNRTLSVSDRNSAISFAERGLPPGAYTIELKASAGATAEVPCLGTVSDVVVNSGQTTELSDLVLLCAQSGGQVLTAGGIRVRADVRAEVGPVCTDLTSEFFVGALQATAGQSVALTATPVAGASVNVKPSAGSITPDGTQFTCPTTGGLVTLRATFTGTKDGRECSHIIDEMVDCIAPEPSYYAFGARARVDGANAAFLYLTPNLDQDLTLAEAALSFGNQAPLVFGPNGNGEFYVSLVGASSTRTVTRYAVSGAGALVETGSASLGKALAEYGASFQIVSEDTAYLVNPDELVVWNPATLEVAGRTPIATAFDGAGSAVARLGATPIRLGDELFFGVGWLGAQSVPMPGSGVVVVDTETHATKVVRDARCPFAREAALGLDGYIYFGTEAYATTARALYPQLVKSSCVVRFDPATHSFDPDFKVEALGLEGGDASSLLPAAYINGPAGRLFARVLDTALVATDPYTVGGPRVLSSAGNVFRWVRIDDNQPNAATVLLAEPTHGSVVPLSLGSRLFAPRFQWGPTADPVSAQTVVATEFVELGLDGPVGVAFKAEGAVFSGIAIR